MRIIDEYKEDSFSRINKFVKNNVDIAKKVAFLKVKTTEALQNEYNKKIGQISQLEQNKGNYVKVFNKFEIQRIQRKQLKANDGVYNYLGYITGSSIKGSVSTAYREFIYKNEGEKALDEKFENKDITKNIFKKLKISDSTILKVGTKIGYACNRERFEDDETGISTFIETINADSEFIVNITYKDLNMQDILNSLNEHYLPIFKTIFQEETKGKDEYILEYLNDSFYEKYKKFQPKESQFLLRVGKHSGARAVTIDGLRDISVKESKYRTLKHQKEETTTWLFGEKSHATKDLLPFGWVLCEIIDD
jgi:CRISPR-associated protein Csm5